MSRSRSQPATRLHVAMVTPYYRPEEVGPADYLQQLAEDLLAKGHRVSVVTAFPNYPSGIVPQEYRGHVFQRDELNGVEVVRTWVYARPGGRLRTKALTQLSFSMSAFFGLEKIDRPDVIFALLPPLPLGVTAAVSAALHKAPLVINLQDIYPDIAVQLGYLRHPATIAAVSRAERWVYEHSDGIIVITDSFRDNLLAKGVPGEKIHVIPNWVDADEITPGPRENSFRADLGCKDDEFLAVYAGGLSRNTVLEPVLEAAGMLLGKAFRFVFVGDGVMKSHLEGLARQKGLYNVSFLPFQPLERYREVLAASDVQLVSLHQAASETSLPSKILKAFSAGRPVLALAEEHSDLRRLLKEFDSGVAVGLDDARGLADRLVQLAVDRQRLERMGANARRSVLERFERRGCIEQIERVLQIVSRKG